MARWLEKDDTTCSSKMKPWSTTGNVPQMLLHNSESRRDELANVDVETHMQDTTAINKATAIFSHLATYFTAAILSGILEFIIIFASNFYN